MKYLKKYILPGIGLMLTVSTSAQLSGGGEVNPFLKTIKEALKR